MFLCTKSEYGRLEKELREVEVEQQTKEQEAQEKLRDMEGLEEEHRQKVMAINELIQEASKAIQRAENKQVVVTKEVLLGFVYSIVYW